LIRSIFVTMGLVCIVNPAFCLELQSCVTSMEFSSTLQFSASTCIIWLWATIEAFLTGKSKKQNRNYY